MPIIDEAVLDAFRGPGFCELCGKRVRRREPHHLTARGFGGGTRYDVRINLLALCATFSGGDNCHHAAHESKVSRENLLAIIAKREERTAESIQEELWRLIRQGKE
jgi:hypothetical protein